MGHPSASTLAPAGVAGHLSSRSFTPSLSESASPACAAGQPFASTFTPAGVLGHWSIPSSTPSLSESCGQPVASTVALAGVLGHLSMPLRTPSLSASAGQPRLSTVAPSGVSGQASSLSETPSRSASLAATRRPASGWKNETPTADQRFDVRRADILRRLKQRLHLQADHRRHGVREPHSPTEFVRQTESLVVFRERAEQADFVPAIVLRRQPVAADKGQDDECRRESPHEFLRPQLVCRSSTRRFSARPAAVVLGATGCVAP